MLVKVGSEEWGVGSGELNSRRMLEYSHTASGYNPFRHSMARHSHLFPIPHSPFLIQTQAAIHSPLPTPHSQLPHIHAP